MGKPVERQNHTLSFFILSVLISVCTGWAFYDEYLARRPWKDFQERIFGFEKAKAALDLAHFERKLATGDIQVVLDPAKPEEKTTVAEARKKLEELEKAVAAQGPRLAASLAAIEKAKIEAFDTDLAVKMLKSEDDGLFYQMQHAQHQEALARTTAQKHQEAGHPAEAKEAQELAEKHAKHLREVEEARAKKHEEIRQAEEKAAASEKALAEVKAKHDELVGERDRLKAAIESALDPVLTAKSSLEAAQKKGTELTQYWLTSYDNSVDRCQNCHASIDRCGFSRPHEVLAAVEKAGDKAAEAMAAFCVTSDSVDSYKATAEAVCAVEWDAVASAAGSSEQGRCFTDRHDRARIGAFLTNYCGPKHQGAVLVQDQALKAACLPAEGWTTLAAYVEDPTRKAGAEGKTWSACDLALAAEGATCVEGAALDQLRAYLGGICAEVSKAVQGLALHKDKVCAAGEDAQRLAAVKPVLFDLPVWAQTHPYRSTLMGSNHPADRFGCTSCHEGQGAQTKGVAGAEFLHGHDDHYWDKPMLDLVVHKKFRPVSWAAPTAGEGVPGTWISHQDHFVESTCSKCHTDEVSLPHADTYSNGRKLVAEIGCYGCHPIDTFAEAPKLGPTLTDLRQKTTPEFLATWIAYPKAFRPRTKMPNFWPEALDVQHRVREGSEEAKERTEDVEKIAAYLWKSSRTEALPPIPVAGDAERGKKLVQSVGCRACHNFSPPEKLCTPEQLAEGKSRGTASEPGECEAPRSLTASEARDFAPNLSNIGLKTNERWLYAWVKNPQSMWKDTRMPTLRLSDQEAADITAYLMTLREGPALSGQPAVFADVSSEAFDKAAAEGDKLVTKYGCAGCHDIQGHEHDAKIGADLNEYGRKTVDLLDFGNAVPNPRHHSWYNFVDLKLRAPRAYRYERVDTRMPQFDFTDAEVESIMVFLKSRTAEKVPAAYLVSNNQRLTAMAHGEQVMERYNCKGCHVIDAGGGRIRDIYLEDDLWRAPPILQAQGWRVQPDWFFEFLKDPSQQLRPWLDVRMPTFPLADTEATHLVAGFSAGSKVPFPYISLDVKRPQGKELEEVKAMVAELRCFNCHTTGEPSPDQDRSSLAPNLALAKHRLRPDWVFEWIKNPQSLQEGTRMPSFFTPDDMSTVMYPKYFGGSQEKQIQLLRDYVMTLPDEPAGAPRAAK
ncbi:MAG: c-type cytochrome [Myxococcota bacterium]